VWAYSGLALETAPAGTPHVRGQLRRSKKQVSIRGLNKDHNHDLKAYSKPPLPGPVYSPDHFRISPEITGQRHQARMVRLTLARKIAAITADSVEEEKTSTLRN